MLKHEQFMNRLLNTMWVMRTSDGWYPMQPSERCVPEDHGALNPRVLTIEDEHGRVIWRRLAS